jgi:hypothetical protein
MFDEEEIVKHQIVQGYLHGHKKFNLICLRPEGVFYSQEENLENLFPYLRNYDKKGWLTHFGKTLDEQLQGFRDYARSNRKMYTLFVFADPNHVCFGQNTMHGFTDEGFRAFLEEVIKLKKK